MHLKNSGKKIIELKFKKNGIEICFDDETKMRVSSDVFSSFYLYESKQLSLEEIKEIERAVSLSNAKKYALKILSEKVYTEKQIYDKLKKRKYSDIEDFNVNAMKDDSGKFYSADGMRKKLAEWQAQIDAKYGKGSSKEKSKVEFNNAEKRAIDALVTLGKSKSEAEQWVQELNMPNSAAEDITYRALRLFGDK